MSAQPIRRWDQETALLAWLAALVSLLSFLFYLRRGEILLYGDAVAHINIARRVFDSRTPGLLQLGTVWLPLPHLLMIPFLLSNWMWKTGVGGSIPSMAAYIFGTVGIFRLVRGVLGPASQCGPMFRFTPWLAAVIYVGNPNLIYLQATAMTEPLYLALFIWAVVYFIEFVQECSPPVESANPPAKSALLKCGICLAAACLTRYDGWFLAAVICVAALAVALPANQPGLRFRLAKFILVAAAAPALWLAYNAIVYRNPLEFANGPYSAKAIEQRTPGAFHPGSHDLPTAFSYFLKSAEVNLAAEGWQKLWILWPWREWLRAWCGSAFRVDCGRCSCSGSRCRSTRFPLLTAACPFSCPCGGRFPITTCATDWNCFRHSRCLWLWRFTLPWS